MKTLQLVVAIAFTFAFQSARSQEQSYIYIYRGGQWSGSLTNFSVYLDGKKICKLSNGKYIKVPVSPGVHELEAKKSGLDIAKKQTSLSVEVEAGKSHYVSCTMKSSITRVRMEMTEVVPSNGKRDLEKMKEDNCSENIDN